MRNKTDGFSRLPNGADHDCAGQELPFDEEPNELTRKTLEMAERGEDLHHAKDLDDLFRQLEI